MIGGLMDTNCNREFCRGKMQRKRCREIKSWLPGFKMRRKKCGGMNSWFEG
jgi:hypothetical protein